MWAGPDTGPVLGNAFAPTMRAAQAGDERAFARLWRDANPLVVRYLRVIGVEDPYDAACEGWVSIVRGVNALERDEKDWRLWVCSCARMCAEESSLRASWSPFRSRASAEATVDGSLDGSLDDLDLDALDLQDLMEPGVSEDPRHRDVNATITALRALPLGQGEVVALRFGWGLPTEDVAGLVGLDASKVRKVEARALERLQTPADLLEWSLNAPATPAELADERIATTVFRSAPRASRNPVGTARIIALGTARPGGTFHRSGHSRTALLGIAALSASVMSFGGLSAAAYVGVLPAPVQSFAHDVVGAPAPAAAPTVKPSAGQSARTGGPTVPTVAVGPDATAHAAQGLCRAWSADKANGTPAASSVAFRNLSRAAGGDGAVDAYCATVLAPGAEGKDGQGKGGPPAVTKTPTPHSPTSRPGSTRTPAPHPTKAPSTKVPSTKAPSTKAPSTKTPTTKATATGKGSTSKVTESTSTQAPAPSAVVSPAPTASAKEPPGRGAGQRVGR